MRQIPDISQFNPHLIIADVDLEGTVIPGLTGEFFSREESGRTATVGRYSYEGSELFIAWGYRDEPHCAWTSYRSRSGCWTPPHQGCPRVSHTDDAVLIDTAEETIRLPLDRGDQGVPLARRPCVAAAAP
ncbi:MAG TPA: hypothetical protein DGT23_05235 [Micromonosporaceae bacterium]|nr:hypothetical protein [Micromonosporaceae bacterium]